MIDTALVLLTYIYYGYRYGGANRGPYGEVGCGKDSDGGYMVADVVDRGDVEDNESQEGYFEEGAYFTAVQTTVFYIFYFYWKGQINRMLLLVC